LAWPSNAIGESNDRLGYAPANAIYLLAGVTALGWIVYRRNLLAIVPSDKDAAATFKNNGTLPPDYPSFAPFFFSLENTFPLVTLGLTEKWQADPAPPVGGKGKWTGNPRFVRIFIWVQILVGWLLATLFVAGISQLVQNG